MLEEARKIVEENHRKRRERLLRCIRALMQARVVYSKTAKTIVLKPEEEPSGD